MLINFTKNHQYSTRMKLNNINVQLVNEMKILGPIVTNNLSWNQNTHEFIKKVNKRLMSLKKIQSFGANTQEMVHVWTVYCNWVLEQSAVVWSSSLTEENCTDLERTQKSFTKLILKKNYTTYEESLIKLNLTTLKQRRQDLTLRFAQNCLKSEKFKTLFPENDTHQIKTRHNEKFKIPFLNTNRAKNSGLTEMKRQLNEHHETVNFWAVHSCGATCSCQLCFTYWLLYRLSINLLLLLLLLTTRLGEPPPVSLLYWRRGGLVNAFTQ